MTQTRDANNLVTKYQYDDKRNLISKTEAYCGCASVIPGTTYYNYNLYGQLTSLVLPTGASISMEYDLYGDLTVMKDGAGAIIESYTRTYYNEGWVKTETDITGTISEFDRGGYLIKSTDVTGEVTTMEYYSNGKLKKMVEDNGTPNNSTDDETSTFEYDNLGRETRADYGDGIYVEYAYTGDNSEWTKLTAPTIGTIERKFTTDGKLAGWITPDGGTPTFIYDQAGRLWRETDASGTVTTEYTYDAIGRVTSVKDVRTGAVATKQYDAGNRVTEEIDPLLGFVRYGYYGARDGGKLKSTTRGQYVRNAAGELVVDSTVALQTTTYEYNGLWTTVIDSLGRRTTSVMDDYSLPIETIFENRNGRNYSSKQKYLYSNNLQAAKDYPTQMIDIGGNDRTYTYDHQGRLQTATDLGDGIYRYTYGEDGLTLIESPISQTKNGATQETLKYAYDDLGNLQSVKYSDLLARSMTYRTTDNRLGTVTLANGESIVYDYDDAGQPTTQTGTGVGTTTMTYTAEGAINTVTDSTGTTTYTYDPQTNQLSRLDNSNGSSIAYTYDLLGRVKTQTEWGSRNSQGYTTEYTYDTFGNLKTVKDPAGGITTMAYDQLNRLTSRALPNGVATTWTYDDLDRIASVTHRNADGEVLASVTYERQGVGEPTKITREDGSYTKVQYDTVLRVTKELFYNAQNVLLDEASYVYDEAGKRIAKVTTLGNQTYNYDQGYQLDNVTGITSEDYAYDANGRMDMIQRDGQTLDLDHDVYDRLASVKNLTSNTTTNYIYDGQGRRITATTGSETRMFLVAPVMGAGLDSTDMMTDGSGNIVSNYVYAGGSSPFMRIDASGNPVYYLTDAMGSVIGLADRAGGSAAKFAYDAFGELRSTSGALSNSNGTGGDFRFQGQWLESVTGIYHFRARDYDSRTGSFLSRDPVDPNEQQPEAMNPYQAMYNNPYVYRDPTGMFTLSELNSSQRVQDILQGIQAGISQRSKQFLIDRAKGVAGDIAKSALKQLLPVNTNFFNVDILSALDEKSQAGRQLESILENAVCNTLLGSFQQYANNLWLDARVGENGKPLSDGFNCGDTRRPDPQYWDDLANNFGIDDARPDFIIKQGGPRSTDHARSSRFPKAYLIGDIKLSGKALERKIGGKQWNAIMGYAKYGNRHQYTPVALYLTYIAPKQGEQKRIEKAAWKQGVSVSMISIIPNPGKGGR